MKKIEKLKNKIGNLQSDKYNSDALESINSIKFQVSQNDPGPLDHSDKTTFSSGTTFDRSYTSSTNFTTDAFQETTKTYDGPHGPVD